MNGMDGAHVHAKALGALGIDLDVVGTLCRSKEFITSPQRMKISWRTFNREAQAGGHLKKLRSVM
jgi:hypothetical protein